MTPDFDNSHDWAVWLLDNLQRPHEQGEGLWAGVLPPQYDFAQVRAAIDGYDDLKGVPDEASRTLEFFPRAAKVYGSLQDLFSHPRNLWSVPPRFTLRDILFTYDSLKQIGAEPDRVPTPVANYLAAARLCQALSALADMATNNGQILHFIKSPDSRIEVKLSYQVADLKPLLSLAKFEAEYAATSHHKDQKRSIVRAVLLEAFKGRKAIVVGDVLGRFEDVVEDVCSNYAMYAAEFSFEKIKAEVEKDNLDSTLKLHKTLSEIQNQLLAVPVAVVLVGGQMIPDSGLSIKNVVIWLGAVAFGVLIVILIRNQLNAIEAIDEEVRQRKVKVDSQPEGMAGKFKAGFDELDGRTKLQKRTLRWLRTGIVAAVGMATVLLVYFSFPDWHDSPLPPATKERLDKAAAAKAMAASAAAALAPAHAASAASSARSSSIPLQPVSAPVR